IVPQLDEEALAELRGRLEELDDLRAGKVLSKKNMEALTVAMEQLQSIIASATPADEAEENLAPAGEERDLELPDLRPLLAELEERGWADIDDWGVWCLTQMISLGSSFILYA